MNADKAMDLMDARFLPRRAVREIPERGPSAFIRVSSAFICVRMP